MNGIDMDWDYDAYWPDFDEEGYFIEDDPYTYDGYVYQA